MEPQRKLLNVCAQKLSLGLVWRELQVFSKLLYRGRNQHRRDKCYQKLTRVSKELRVYQGVALTNHVKKLVKLVSSSRAVTPSITAQGAELASKLVDSARFVIRLVEFVKDTFREVDQRLRMSLFIPFNVLMAASLTRIWYCLHYHLLAISETYGVVKQSLLSSSKEFLPSLGAYLSKKQSRTYLSFPKEQQLQIDDLGTAVQRSHQILPVSMKLAEDKMEEERAVLKEVDTVITVLPHSKEPLLEALSQPAAVKMVAVDIPSTTEVDTVTTTCMLPNSNGFQLMKPLSSSDEECFIISEPVAAKTVAIDLPPKCARKKNAHRRKRANTLTFQFHYGRRHSIKIRLKSSKLLAILSSKNLSVTGTDFKYMRQLPTGYHVPSRFSITMAQHQPQSNMLRRRPASAMCGELRVHRAMEDNHWMEIERNRLVNQRSGSSSCVHRLQKQLTEDLDSAAAITDRVAMETDLECDTDNSLINDKNKIEIKGMSNEIDDIFGALDGL